METLFSFSYFLLQAFLPSQSYLTRERKGREKKGNICERRNSFHGPPEHISPNTLLNFKEAIKFHSRIFSSSFGKKMQILQLYKRLSSMANDPLIIFMPPSGARKIHSHVADQNIFRFIHLKTFSAIASRMLELYPPNFSFWCQAGRNFV